MEDREKYLYMSKVNLPYLGEDEQEETEEEFQNRLKRFEQKHKEIEKIMKIKSQKDVTELLKLLKETKTKLIYETESAIVKIQYINDNFNLSVKSTSFNCHMDGNEKEELLFHRIWFDRKYVNKVL